MGRLLPAQKDAQHRFQVIIGRLQVLHVIAARDSDLGRASKKARGLFVSTSRLVLLAIPKRTPVTLGSASRSAPSGADDRPSA
jgi:hypothetical protein